MSDLLRPLSISEILDGAFTLYRRHLGTLLSIGAAVHLLPALVAVLAPSLAGFLLVLLGPLLDAALIRTAADAIQGRPTSSRDGLAAGVRLYVPLAVLSIAFFVVLALSIMAASIPAALSGALLPITAVVTVPAAGAALVWWLVSLFAWRQVVVLEREWNFFRRSFDLARGGRWQILWVALIGMLLVALVGVPFGVGLVLSGGFDEFGAYQPSYGLLLLQYALTILTRPFTHLLFTLLYFSRRVDVEGYDVERSLADLERAAAGGA